MKSCQYLLILFAFFQLNPGYAKKKVTPFEIEQCFHRIIQYHLTNFESKHYSDKDNPSPLLEDLIPVSLRPNLALFGTKKGEHGQKITVYMRIDGEGWNSNYGPTPFALLGDSRWFIHNIGVDVAQFLGWKLLDENFIAVPHPEELNLGIEKLNSMLKRKIPVKFIEVSGKISDRKYLEISRFESQSDSFLIPISNEQSPYIRMHDLFYHASMMLYPRPYLERSSKINQTVLDFIDYIRSHYNGKVPEHFDKLISLATYVRAHELDSATADLSSTNIRTTELSQMGLKIEHDMQMKPAQRVFVKLTGGHRSLADYLFDLFQGSRYLEHHASYAESRTRVREYIESEFTAKENSQLKQLLTNFINQNPKLRQNITPSTLNARDLSNHFMGRRIALTRALQELKD